MTPARYVKPLTLLTMCLGLFLPQLDTTVVNLALPSIQRSLHLDVAELQWIIDSYNLTFACLLLLGGILGDLFGRKRLFLSGLMLFTLGSLLCGVAPNLALLLSGRLLQGLGAALELPQTLSILTATYTDPRQRARAIGIWASIAGMALAIGPTAGALLVTTWGWQSMFFLNLPTGLGTLVLASSTVRESLRHHGRRLDLPGQLLAILFLFSFTYAVIESETWGWHSPLILMNLAIALGSFAAFVGVEWRTAGAMVPLAVFRQPAFSAALAMASLMTFGMYGMFFLVSLYLQSITHASPLLAGLQQLPLSLTFIIVSPLAGRLMSRFGPRCLTTAGMGLMGSGLLSLLFLAPQQATWFLLLVMSFIGIGLGLNMGPVLTVAMGSIPAERSGMASGLSNVARMVGATLGVALLGALLAGHLSQGHGNGAFLAGLHIAFLAGGGTELVGALLALRYMPGTAGMVRQASTEDSGSVPVVPLADLHKKATAICLLQTRTCQ